MATFAAAMALLVTCAEAPEPPETRTVLSLAEAFDGAEIGAELRSLDLTAPEARSHLGSGWSRSRRRSGGSVSATWAVGGESRLTFTLVERRDLTLRLTGSAYRDGEVRSQRVTVELNGAVVGELDLPPRSSTHEITVPEGATRLGQNALVLRHSAFRSGARPLAASWKRIEMLEARSPLGQPEARPSTDSIFLPFDTALSFLTSVPAGAELALDSLESRGAEGGLVLVRESDGAHEVAGRLDPGSGQAVSLREGIARLTLIAEPRGGHSARDGLLLRGARVRGRASIVSPLPVERSAAGLPNVLVYLVDTLRADRVGVYGAERPLTPEIDRFAGGATVFENTVGQSSWTRASVASIFTGLWPLRHGAVGRRDGLSESASSLAEVLRAAGYRTAAMVTNPNVARAFGLAQGFDEYRQYWKAPRSEEIARRALAWIDENADREPPFFLYLHTVDPHDPYLPPEDLRARFAPGVPAAAGRRPAGGWNASPATAGQLAELYDAEVAANDRGFGALLDGLEERGLDAGTLVVFTSDHGEEFQEHGAWTHGKNLHAETLDAPLIVRFPGQSEPLRVAGAAQHVDVLPTLLDYLDLPTPAGLDGKSLLRGVEGPVFSHLHLEGPAAVSVVEGVWKLIAVGAPGGSRHYRLYRRDLDPAEESNLADRYPITVSYLDRLIQERLMSSEERLESEEAQLDPELERNLKALGYLN